MFIIIETIVNIEHEDFKCFKGHRCFSKNLFMSIRHEKETPCSHYFSFFSLSNLPTQTCLHLLQDRAAQNMRNVHIYIYIYNTILFIIAFVSLSVPTYCILMQLNSQ